MSRPTNFRIAGAIFLLLGGSVHLHQWHQVYRDTAVGPSFVVNAVVSLVIGIALLARDDRMTPLAGIAVSLGSLAALALSRTVGLFGFEETGLAVASSEAIAVELAAAITLAVAFRWPSSPSSARATN